MQLKKLKRIFFKDGGERIFFGTKKGSTIERYFNKSKNFLQNEFSLEIDHGTPPVPKKLKIYFIYLDENCNEYILKKELDLSERQPHQTGKVQTIIPVKIEQNGKVLYKVKFEHIPTTDSSIYITYFLN